MFTITDNMMLIWIVAIIIFCIIEIATIELTTIWLAGGSLISLLCAALNLNLTVQFIGFVATSLLLLIFTRPIAVKYLNKNVTKTNVNSVIDKTGIVISDILPMKVGQVKVSGQIWTAISENENEVIKKDTKIKVIKISGVKLIVKKIN